MIPVMRKMTLIVVGTVALYGSAFAQSAASDPFPVFPELGRYADTLSQICGRKKVDLHPTKIPLIGCFAVKVGTPLSGEIEGRKVTIRQTLQEEVFTVDGAELRRTSSSTTNDSSIRPSSSGFAFCRQGHTDDCPVMIDTLMRRAGSFAIFDVSRAFKPRSYVTNQENWDFESKR